MTFDNIQSALDNILPNVENGSEEKVAVGRYQINLYKDEDGYWGGLSVPEMGHDHTEGSPFETVEALQNSIEEAFNATEDQFPLGK